MLKRLADESAYITRADVLVSRVLEALGRYARTDGAALYLRDEAGAYTLRGATFEAPARAIDENDSAVVSLRATRAPVDVNDGDSTTSQVPGIVAFPMLVRGELTGLLACGPRASGEAYDPDERRLLATLANALAAAFSSIETAELKVAINRALIGDLPIETLRQLRFRFG